MPEEQVAPQPEVPVDAPADPAPSPKPQEEIKPDTVSDKFSVLARKERSILKAKQEALAIKADAERQISEFKAHQAEFERFMKLKENAKLDPDAYLNEAGLTYGYLTERNLKGGTDPQAVYDKTKAEIDAFKREQADKEQKAKDAENLRAQKEWEQRIANFKVGIDDFVEQNADNYELIKLHNQQNLVFEVISEGARRGEALTVKDASDKVEAYLSQEVEKALGTKKFKDKVAPKAAEKPVTPGDPTLNNQMSTTTPTQAGRLSDAERTQRALAALNKALGE